MEIQIVSMIFELCETALVDASGRAELYGTIDQSIDPDLGLYEPD